MPEPDLRALQVFAAVATSPTLSAAARALGLPLSTVSRRLQELERTLGETLLLRSTRRLQLTEPGRALLVEVEGPLAALRQAGARLRAERSGGPRGHLRIAAAPTAGMCLLPDPLARYLEENRGVTAEVLLGEAALDLAAAGVDVALRVGPMGQDPSLVVRRLRRTRPRLVAAPAYLRRRGTPRTLRDLGAHDVVGLVNIRAWRFEEERHALPAAARVLASSAAFARLLCLRGAGIALLPEFLVEPDLRAGDLIDIALPKAAAAKDIYVAYLPEARQRPEVRAFLALLRESVTAP